VLAERLGMTVSELDQRISSAELVEWIAHDELTRFEREQEQKRQEMESRMRRH